MAFVLLWVIASLLDLLPTAEERVRWQAKATIGLAALMASAAQASQEQLATSIKEAHAEARASFGRDGNAPGMALVCDDCYQKLNKRFQFAPTPDQEGSR